VPDLARASDAVDPDRARAGDDGGLAGRPSHGDVTNARSEPHRAGLVEVDVARAELDTTLAEAAAAAHRAHPHPGLQARARGQLDPDVDALTAPSQREVLPRRTGALDRQPAGLILHPGLSDAVDVGLFGAVMRTHLDLRVGPISGDDPDVTEPP